MNNASLIAFQTLLFKEIVRFMRIWSQTLLPPAITMALYFIIFGKLIGSQLKDVHGYSYMTYIVPGLTMMSVMTNAYANSSSSFFGAKFSRSIEELLVSSMPSYVILLGYMIGGALRGLLAGLIVILISMFFTPLHIQHITLVILMGVLSAMLFSLAGLLNGIFAKKFDDVAFIPTFVLTPLTYLGGIFYSIHQLPIMFQYITYLNPIFNIVDAFKYGMLGVSDVNFYLGFSLVLGLFIVLFWWCLRLLQKGVGLRS
ncbi:MAG TPA: ABC transporter permease [Gammaproteobacteria bacterium]|jgi:ABC-2 type transport system permease protein|nr:ABC transporter permease [Gammaproteobacteria bacterium]